MNDKINKQYKIEKTFSKHNIRNKIEEDLNNSNLKAITQRVITAIKNYRKGEYYESKQERIKKIRPVLSSDIVMEMFIIITPDNGVQPIQAVASRLALLFEYENVFDGIKTASELLAVACKEDMFDIISAKNSDTGSIMIKSKYSLEEHTLQYIENTKYLPPMICKPRPVTSNISSGYLTKSESVILGSNNHHEMYQALDVLCISQDIELSLDVETLKFIEEPKKPLDTPEKASNWDRFIKASKLVYYDILSSGNKFHLTYKYDKRGRIYSQGYNINIQSTSYKKALINFSEKHLITGV